MFCDEFESLLVERVYEGFQCWIVSWFLEREREGGRREGREEGEGRGVASC